MNAKSDVEFENTHQKAVWDFSGELLDAVKGLIDCGYSVDDICKYVRESRKPLRVEDKPCIR